MSGRKWQEIDWRDLFLLEQQPTEGRHRVSDIACQVRDNHALIVGRTQIDIPAF